MSLKEFEKQHKLDRGPLCTVCALSEELRSELNDAEDRRTSRAVSAKYLESLGVSVQGHTIGDHYRKGHRNKETQ